MTEMRADLCQRPAAAYRAATTPHNATVVQRPVMVAHPGRAEEVAQAVQWAARCNLEVAVQASGHGAGAPIESDRVLVETRGFSTVHIDAQARVGSPRSATRCTRVSSIRT
jgi:FAD/FMN-containing dehydrogenase